MRAYIQLIFKEFWKGYQALSIKDYGIQEIYLYSRWSMICFLIVTLGTRLSRKENDFFFSRESGTQGT